MMRAVHLHGALGKEFGRSFQFDVDTITDVLCALRVNFPRFANAIRNGFYKVIIGKSIRKGLALGENELGFNLGRNDVHIVPQARGRKRGGMGKVIAGIALIGLSMVPGANVALWGAASAGGGMTAAGLAGTLGTSMLLTGVASLIAPEMNGGDTEQSFTMTGPTSNIREGNIVPIAYGEVITGGYLISGSVTIGSESSGGSSGSLREMAMSVAGGSASRQAKPGGAAPAEQAGA